MDPLSITASAITLIQAAGAVRTALQRLAHSLKTADSRITDLCNELVNLTAFLEAVERTLKGCRPLDSACVEEDLWHQSELCLVDCQVTLNELAVLVDKIKRNIGTRSFGWRVRAAVDLSVYGPEIAVFRDKIHKSNWALQTLLHTITVSLSLRNNASQEMILFELDRLKTSIDEALMASLRPPQGFSDGRSSDSRVARNLRNLAAAARNFHSTAASSTASTIREPSGSLIGDFPAYRRERVETFIRYAPHGLVAATGHATPSATQRAVSPPPDSVRGRRSPPIANPVPLRVATLDIPWSVVEDDEDDEAEFEKLFLNGLEDLAKDSIRRKQFEKAIALLTEAIQRREKTGCSKEDVRRLQIQIALCHFFRDDWKQAEPLVSSLARSGGFFSYWDLIVWSMLHALALAHLANYTFDSALDMCKKATQAQKKWARSQQIDRRQVKGCAETTGLLATIFHMKGDFIAAEIYRRQLPEHFVYRHYRSPREFLASQCDLLEGVLGNDLPNLCDDPPVYSLPGFHQLSPVVQSPAQETFTQWLPPGGGDVSPLRASRYQWEKYEADTGKEAVALTTDPPDETNDADDEATMGSSSPCDTADIGGIRRRATRIFGTMRDRHRAPGRRDASADSGAFPTESTFRRWFKGGNIFAVKPSRTVLRKRQNHDTNSALQLGGKRPRTFRVLNVVHVTGHDSDASSPTHESSRTSSTIFDAPSTPAEISAETCAACPAPGGLTDEDTTDLAVRNGVLPDTPCISELPDTPFSGASRQRAQNQADLLNFLRQYSLFPPEKVSHPSYHNGTGMSHLALPSWRVPPRMAAPHARGARAERQTTGAVIEGPNGLKKVDTILARGRPEMLRRAVVPEYNKPITAAVLPTETATALSKLAGILVSLPEARKSWDQDRLHAARLELEALSACLNTWSTDSTLRRDVQAVISFLPAGTARAEKGQDSGYESMTHENSEDEMTLDGEFSGSGHAPEKMKSNAPRKEDGEKPRKGGLKRQFLWVTGDGALYRADPGGFYVPKQAPGAEGALVVSSGEHVECAPGKDPSRGAVLVEEVNCAGRAEISETKGGESTEGGTVPGKACN